MATGLQVEELTRDIASGKPSTQRTAIQTAFSNLGGSLLAHATLKTLLDTVVTDADSAGQNAYDLEQVQADWGSNLVSVVNSSFSYDGKTGINALAQLIADLSEQAGLEGGANRLRLFKGAPASETIVAVDQDA